jgi:hypothetical protein
VYCTHSIANFLGNDTIDDNNAGQYCLLVTFCIFLPMFFIDFVIFERDLILLEVLIVTVQLVCQQLECVSVESMPRVAVMLVVMATNDTRR